MASSGNYTFDALSKIVSNAGSYGVLIIIFAVLALFLMLLIEGCRVPVDDPATHLELTMIHEVMILDNSASDLALISYGASIKMLLISSLIARLIIPESITGLEYFLYYLLIIFAVSIITGTVESSTARLRMSHVFEFVFVMSSFALIILSLTAARIFGG